MTAAIDRLAAALRAGTTSSTQLVANAIERAQTLKHLGTFAQETFQSALADAKMLDGELAASVDRGPLHGIPITVKDVIDVRGVPTRLGTAGAGHFVPRNHAALVDRAVQAGAVVLGKAATHELAFGTITPGVLNPRDPRHIAGGSSGGSAAGVAAGIVPLSLATDTAGSIRCPAALCGVVGFRPAHGAASTAGVAPLAPSQDTIGVIGVDLGSTRVALRELGMITDGRRPVGRVGFLPTLLTRVEPAVRQAFQATLDRLSDDGISAVALEIPDVGKAPAASLIVMLAEAAAVWRHVATEPPSRLGASVAGALYAGRGLDPHAVSVAKAVGPALRQELEGAFAEHALDALVWPTLPTVAAKVGHATMPVGERVEPVEAAHARHVSIAAVTGLPALTVPCGRNQDLLPIGVEVVTLPGDVPALFAVADLIEASGVVPQPQSLLAVDVAI